jgi:hypothetical protein
MVSSLYWQFGFGWYHTIIMFSCIFFTYYFKGVPRGIFLTFSVFLIIFSLCRYHHWNSTPWRRLHGRGMLLYARYAGIEKAISEKEQRSFSIEIACEAMALDMCGGKGPQVSAMITALEKEKGLYFMHLINDYRQRIDCDISDLNLAEILKSIIDVKMCPQLVIANIIENTYGAAEAAKYVIALSRGDAK